MEKTICKQCKKEFMAYQYVGRLRIHCSKKCYGQSDRFKSSWNKGLKQSKETIEKRTNTTKSRFNGHGCRWIEDKSKLVKNERKDLDSAYMTWSKNVKNRDHWKCRIANQDCNGRLEAHHILRWRDYPELRYDINNGITLCVKHHPRKRDEETRLSPYFQEIISKSTLL